MTVLVRLVLFVSCFLSAASLKRGTQELVSLVTDFDGHMYNYNINTSQTTRVGISDSGQGPEAVDYDPVNGKIYWTNIRADNIKRANIDGSNEETILKETETPRGVAVDYIKGLLFYTEEKIDIIGRVDLTNLTNTRVLNTGMDRPLAITLDMQKEVFYWTDIGSRAKIEKAFYNGTGRTALVSSNLKWPIALALDETREKLFWCDGSIKKIQYINLVTMAITVVIYKYDTHYYDINYVDGTIYFVDLLKRNTFQSIPATGGNVTTFALGRTLSKWRKIRVIKITACDDMTWGPNCSNNCGHCVDNAVCNKNNGHCPGKCQDGYSGSTCIDACPNGFYGKDCKVTCGMCHARETCDHVTGLCMYGCAAGWDGTYCKDECPGGKHGKKCENVCGNCRRGVECDKQTGNCSAGCAPGWMGSQCKDGCFDGTFGVDCQYLCQCHDGAICNKLTGECRKEIVPLRICPDHLYGFNCSQTCGHCLNGQPCNETTGQCPSGCNQGWKGDACLTECPPGRYGFDCAQICRCPRGQVCDPVRGKCYGGTLTPQRQVGKTHFTDTVLTTILCVVIVIMAVLLAVALVYICRRRRIEKSLSRESLSTEKSYPVSFNTGHEPLVHI